MCLIQVEEIGTGYGEFVRAGGADDGSESKHGVVHVPRCMDHIHPNIILLMAGGALCFRLLSRHGVDHRSSRSFHCTLIRFRVFLFFFFFFFE